MSERKQLANGWVAWLTRLARDARANTAAIVAISLIPLAGMVGGGVDISRMYIVKTRLQHACDAGALAGRKQMGGGTWSYNSYEARSTAEKFFDANIQSNPYGASDVTKSFSESAGKVSGTASATLPMTIMRMFGRTTETLSVTCDAEMRLPNTDVMFVLDTTGSMADKAVSTDTQTKIQALKSSVKCFYEIVARLDTAETCVTGTPSGGTGDAVQIRFGFVPYATNVNVGKLLPTDFIADNWSYQSREPQWNAGSTTYTYPNPAVASPGSPGSGSSDWSDWSVASGYSCSNTPADTNVSQTYSYDTPVTTTNGVRTWSTRTYSTVQLDYEDYSSRFSCVVIVRKRGIGNYTVTNYTQTPVAVTSQTFNRWRYALVSHNVSGLKNGASWNNTVSLPIGSNGTMRTLTWDGCIEERPTVFQSSYSTIPAAAKDLNIDLVPSTSDPTTQWGPALPEAIFARAVTSDWNQLNRNEALTTANYYNNVPYYCPTEARKLQGWTSASTFETYVDSLTPNGNTYHDIGLLWGARFISPTGIFKAENEFTPKGAEIERHLIFMTDGEACTNETDYAAYGFSWLDRRTTDPSVAPTGGCLTTGTITQQINARTAGLCTAVKNKNITLWVIWFGASNTTIEGMLENCATSGRFFKARNSADLQNTFKSIADQISQLRLTK